MSTRTLDLIDVHARYGEHNVLSGVSVHVNAGEWLCLLGPNGAGKSTLLHCISGEMRPAAGEVMIAGHSAIETPHLAKRSLGFAARPEQLPALLTGRECLQIIARAKSLSTIDESVIELAHTLGFSRFMDRCVDTYSLGTRQKLCVLLALIGSPRLIVLDEAFNGLDPASSLALKRHLEDRIEHTDCSVLLATHSLDIVEHYADRAALLLDGRIARVWDREDLDELRAHGGNALEESVSAIR